MQRIPELRILTEDHHHGLVLARHALLAKDDSSAKIMWVEIEKAFQSELNPHFIIEEKYLAPPLELLGETKLLERLHRDHKELRSIILDSSDRSLLTIIAFGELLKSHIRFEERELFEKAQIVLTPESLKKVEQACLLSRTRK